MDRIKAIYRWEDKTTPVVIIGVTDKGLTCVFPDNGQIAYLPPMNVMVDLADWNGQSAVRVTAAKAGVDLGGNPLRKPADVDLEGLGYHPYPFDMFGLQHAVDSRNADIDPDGKLGALFFATELGGECGEALNKVKKLERERLGILGSTTTVAELGDELADTIITACNLARQYDINLTEHIRNVFNETSRKRGLRHRL